MVCLDEYAPFATQYKTWYRITHPHVNASYISITSHLSSNPSAPATTSLLSFEAHSTKLSRKCVPLGIYIGLLCTGVLE